MTKKSTPNSRTTVVTWISNASVEGLARVMVLIGDQSGRFSDEQNAKLADLIDKDSHAKTKARLSSIEETGTEGFDTVQPLIETCSFDDMLKFVNAVDKRLLSIPDEQRGEVADLYSNARLQEMTAALGLNPDPSYEDELEEGAADELRDE